MGPFAQGCHRLRGRWGCKRCRPENRRVPPKHFESLDNVESSWYLFPECFPRRIRRDSLTPASLS
jgi:hypothetical protein